MSKSNVVVYTSINTYLTANNKPLGFVQEIEIEDVVVDEQKYTDITLYRLANDSEDVINEMRFKSFTFKMFNSLQEYTRICFGGKEEVAGYVSPEANVISFKMSLSAKIDGGKTDLLKQKIVIRAKSFMYSNNICAEEADFTDEEDFKNLINILKKNQEAVKSKPPAAILPASEQTPDEVEHAKKKDKKKKKSK